MSRSLSTTAASSINAQSTTECWLILITIEHTSLSEPIRIVNNNENITSNNNLFVALDFKITLPSEDSENPVSAHIEISNVDQVIIKSIRSIYGTPTVTLQVILASQPNVVEIEYSKLNLVGVTYNAATISGELRPADIMSEPIALTMTPAYFPGLF